MALLYDINTKLEGEKKLFTEYGKIIPLIVEHFQPFDGQRAMIASGDRSAKFARTVREFQEAARETTQARVTIDSHGGMSAWIKIDVTIPDPRSPMGGCIYFKHSAPVGDIDKFGGSDAFSYTFKPEEAQQHVDKILAVKDRRLQEARDTIALLKKQIENELDRIPYEFRPCVIEDGRLK